MFFLKTVPARNITTRCRLPSLPKIHRDIGAKHVCQTTKDVVRSSTVKEKELGGRARSHEQGTYPALSGKVVITMNNRPDVQSLPEREATGGSKVDRVYDAAISAAHSTLEASTALRRFLEALEDLGR